MYEELITYVPPTKNYMIDDTTILPLLERVSECEKVVVDVETDGLRPWHGNKLCGIGFALGSEEGYYLPFRHPEGNLSEDYFGVIWDHVKKVPRLIGHNIKFDMAFLHSDGYRIPKDQILSDTMQSSRLCAREQYPDLSLPGRLANAFGWRARMYDDEFKAYLTKNKWKYTFHLAPSHIVGSYCVGDVIGTWNLLDHDERIIEESKQWQVWEEEQFITRILWEMESIGMRFDSVYASKKVPLLQARCAEYRK